MKTPDFNSADGRLLDIIDRMRSVAEQIKTQKLELERQQRVMLLEKGQQRMVRESLGVKYLKC